MVVTGWNRVDISYYNWELVAVIKYDIVQRSKYYKFFNSLSVAIIRFYPSLIFEDKPGYLGGSILGPHLSSELMTVPKI